MNLTVLPPNELFAVAERDPRYGHDPLITELANRLRPDQHYNPVPIYRQPVVLTFHGRKSDHIEGGATYVRPQSPA